MKIISKYIVIAISLIFISCEKLVEGFETDPNNPSDAPVELMLNGAQVGLASTIEGELARLAGMWSGQFRGNDRQYVSLWEYSTVSGDFDNAWGNIYYTLAQLKIIQKKSDDRNDPYFKGIAQVMEAHLMGTTAALWGDVPYSEAADDAISTPSYDTQVEVYTAIQSLLDAAIVNLNKTSGVNPGGQDIFYGGSLAKWRQAANTLKARYYLHTKNYTSAITSALSGISSTANSMYISHGSTYGVDFNTYYSFLTYDRPNYMTADDVLAPTILEDRNNAKTDESGRYYFYFFPGLNTAGLDPNVLVDFDWGVPSTSNGFFGATTKFPLITYEENQLILAEAYARTNQDANALTSLNNVRAFLNSGAFLLGSTDYADGSFDPSINSFYASYITSDFQSGGLLNNGTLTQNEALLKEILVERYLTLLGQIEVFNDVRRTLADTKTRVPVTANLGSQIPQRFLYPQNEINTNKTNIPSPLPTLFQKTAIFQ